MERIWIYYYLFLLLALVAGIGYYIVTGMSHRVPVNEHPIGVNLTKESGICKITWLGGWDFDSFYNNVTVNDVNVGHPTPMTIIYNDTCKPITVRMYDRSVRTDIELYRYNNSGVV